MQSQDLKQKYLMDREESKDEVNEAEASFLTPQERADLKALEEDRMDLVGQIDGGADDSFIFKALQKMFQQYPVQWVNSSDLLYAEPQGAEWSWGAKTQDEDEGEQEQALKGKVNQRQSLPWLYQDGMIFKAYIVRQTAKALLLKTKIGTFWVPKSQVDFEPQGSYTQDGHVWLPQWLIDEKGLSKEDAAEGLNFEFEWEPSLKALGPQAKPPKKKMKRGKASKGGK